MAIGRIVPEGPSSGIYDWASWKGTYLGPHSEVQFQDPDLVHEGGIPSGSSFIESQPQLTKPSPQEWERLITTSLI